MPTKLVVQIPCLNEETTLPATLADIPREIPGVDQVEVLIIDDGSTDRTVEVARAAGVEHVVSFTRNKGLAAAFMAGLEASLELGADVIVHTDADNQYQGSCIPDLIRPIVEHRADLVVGVRPIEEIEDFSWLKKRLQRLGSWAVRRVSGTNIADTTSGFRAYSREAAMRLNVISGYTYTLETLIQAGRSDIAVEQVPIHTNRKTRESRLFHSIPQYISRSVDTIVRIYAIYEPFRFFSTLGTLLFLPGLLLGLRFLYLYAVGKGHGHVQSLILASLLMLLGVQLGVIGFVADLIAANRKLSQDLLYQVRQLRHSRKPDPS